MGKKLINEDYQPEGVQSHEQASDMLQDREILIEITQHGVNNTSALLARRPQLISKNTSSKFQKQRKMRVYNPDDRFSNAHIRRYYLFPFYYSTLFPYFKISWKVWKPNSVYKYMSRFLSNIPGQPNKTPIQCKSFDQRMKEQNYASAMERVKMDLFETAFAYLKEEKLNREESEIIKNYIKKMQEKSSFMNFIQDGPLVEEDEEESEQIKRHSDPFIPYEKKEETSLGSPNVEGELIFNQFLDIQK